MTGLLHGLLTVSTLKAGDCSTVIVAMHDCSVTAVWLLLLCCANTIFKPVRDANFDANTPAAAGKPQFSEEAA